MDENWSNYFKTNEATPSMEDLPDGQYIFRKRGDYLAYRDAPAWRPIETAPRDGCLILGCTDGGIVQVMKLNKHLQIWVEPDGRETSRRMAHWMPLPSAHANTPVIPPLQPGN